MMMILDSWAIWVMYDFDLAAYTVRTLPYGQMACGWEVVDLGPAALRSKL